MFDSAYLLLSLFDDVELVEGRKKLQKMVHLLTTAGAAFSFKYQYHHYGPYSAQLQDEINFMVRQGFIEEFKEKETYVYKITERGKEFKLSLERTNNGDLNRELVLSLNEHSSQFLEMVSTYAFLLDSGYDSDSAIQKAIELKPHLSGYSEDARKYYHRDISYQ
ncbi:YwgA family protein [Desulfosporosinus fructosivorans]